MTEWYEVQRTKRDEPDNNDMMMVLGYIVKNGETIKQQRAEMRERLERIEKRQEELEASIAEYGELLKRILAKLEE